jgi:hypothetical protein
MTHRPDGSARLLSPEDTLGGEDVRPGFRLALAERLGGIPASSSHENAPPESPDGALVIRST